MNIVCAKVMPRDDRCVPAGRYADAENGARLQPGYFISEKSQKAGPVSVLPINAVVIEHVIPIPKKNSAATESLCCFEELIYRKVKLLLSPRKSNDQNRGTFILFDQDWQSCAAQFGHPDTLGNPAKSEGSAAGNQLGHSALYGMAFHGATILASAIKACKPFRMPSRVQKILDPKHQTLDFLFLPFASNVAPGSCQ